MRRAWAIVSVVLLLILFAFAMFNGFGKRYMVTYGSIVLYCNKVDISNNTLYVDDCFFVPSLNIHNPSNYSIYEYY